MNKTKSELLPCPFCGGEAEIVHYQSGVKDRQCYVCCKDCKASTFIQHHFKEKSMQTWNTRKDDRVESIDLNKVNEFLLSWLGEKQDLNRVEVLMFHSDILSFLSNFKPPQQKEPEWPEEKKHQELKTGVYHVDEHYRDQGFNKALRLCKQAWKESNNQ